MACDSCHDETEDLSVACERPCHSTYALTLVRKAPDSFEPD